MKTSIRTLVSCLILTLGLTFNLTVYSQGESVSNGYMCDPKNPGGEDTRKYYRQQDGLAITIAPSSSFPIVCPVILPFQLPPYEISIGLVNTNSTTQKFSCAAEENDLNGNIVRTQGNAINIPPRSGGFLYWPDISLVEDTNYLSLRCILPPKGAVSFLEWF